MNTNQQAKEDHPDSLGKLKGLGVSTLPELLLYLPRAYRDFSSPVSQWTDLTTDQPRYFTATVMSLAFLDKNSQPTWFAKGQPVPYRARITLKDSTSSEATAQIFGATWPWRFIRAGNVVHLYGSMRDTAWGLQISTLEVVPPEWRGRVMPVYPTKQGIASQKTISAAMVRALEQTEAAAYMVAGEIGLGAAEIAQRTGVRNLARLLQAIHAPGTMAEAARAIARTPQLAALQVVTTAERFATRTAERRSVVGIAEATVERLVAALPYTLTDDQRSGIRAVVEDLRSPYPMRRLLSGDVCTGKTSTYLIPAIAAIEAGVAVAVLAPNQLLVAQIASEIRKLEPSCGTFEVQASTKGPLPQGVILVGTTALLSRVAKEQVTLGLLVVDEQHKLSQQQREALVGAGTNLLEATATAIPRTLALVTHGGMDVSVLKECPVKKHIATRIVPVARKREMLQYIKKVTDEGGQVAVIYPLVTERAEETKDGDLAVEPDGKQRLISIEEAAKVWERLMPGRIGVIHGRMTDDEKIGVIERMKRREFDVLVSSTVIELGITLPYLRALVVVNAERYGVSQLHQLRGRVARGGGKGAFLMYLPQAVEQDAMNRLQLLVDYQGGFDLAENDMNQRGFGDLSGDLEKQTGVARTLFVGVTIMPADIAQAMGTEKKVVPAT